MLHLISQTSIEPAVLARIEPGDSVVFLDGAVLRIIKQGAWADSLTRLASRTELFALEDDLLVRGIEPERVVSGITLIDFHELVRLTVKHPLTQSWI